MLYKQVFDIFIKKANLTDWKILVLQIACLLYPLFRGLGLPIFTAPVGLIVSSNTDISIIMNALSPLAKFNLYSLNSRRSVEKALQEESFEIIPFIFIRNSENYCGLEELFTLTVSQDPRLGNRLPIVFFIGGIPKQAKSLLAGKFDLYISQKIITAGHTMNLQTELISFIKNRGLLAFTVISMGNHQIGSTIDWLKESALCLTDFFESVSDFNNQIDAIRINIFKATQELKDDYDSLMNGDDIPRLFISLLRDSACDLGPIFDIENVSSDTFKKSSPLYDSDFYYITGQHLKSIIEKMLPIAGEGEIKEVLSSCGILSRTGHLKPVYGRKVSIRFIDGGISQSYFFPIPRSFLDIEGELTWAEKILIGVDEYEQKNTFMPNNWNNPRQLSGS